MSKANTVAALSALDGISFFGVHLPNPDVASASTGSRQRSESTEASAAQLLHFKRVVSHIADAVKHVGKVIDDDLTHQAEYEFHPSVSYGRFVRGKSVTTSRVSVFADSGLPRVKQLGEFVRLINLDFGKHGVLPFFDVSEQALGEVWTRPGTTILRNKLRQSLGNLTRYLARMEWRNTEAWVVGASEDWERDLKGSLVLTFRTSGVEYL